MEIFRNQRDNIRLIFVLCQVFKNSGGSAAQPFVPAVVYWPYLVLCEVAGRG